MRYTKLEHRFVQYIPEQLEPGVLYISMEYATAAHNCCCGCGLQVVTPFTPADWKLTFDGETVSLWPSIGNWNFPCRSHYVIRHNRIIAAERWDDDKVKAGRDKDHKLKKKYFESKGEGEEPKPTQPTTDSGERRGLWEKIKKRVQ